MLRTLLGSLGAPVVVALCQAQPLPAQSISHSFHGDSNSDWFGMSVSSAGDVDGDFHDDLIVSAPFGDAVGVDTGYVRIFSGQTGALLSTFEGTIPGDGYGASVSSAGDFNADGVPDVVIGARYWDLLGTDSGLVQVYSPLTGAVLFGGIGTAGDQFGARVAAAGDVNADGFDDILTAAHGALEGRGRVSVYSGRNGTILHNFVGSAAGDVLGWSLDAAGDVNNDGFADVILGSRSADTFGPDAGLARVYSGQDGSLLHEFIGDATFDEFGYDVAGIGDVNGDWHDDVAIGAFRADANGTNSGTVRVHSGIDGSLLFAVHGDSAFDGFGFSVCGAGDVDGDGSPDIAVGAIGDDDGGIDAGSVRIVSGADGSTLHTFYGDSAFDNLGFSIASAGDPDNDGFTEVISGAYRNDVGGTDTGSAFVLDMDAVGTPPRKWVFGGGCLGSAGMPSIDARNRLAIGETCRLTLHGAPPNSPTTSLMIGDPFPIPLDVLGLVGCTLFQTPWTTVNVPVDAFGMTRIDLTLPDDAAMVGLLWDYQFVILDFLAPQPEPLSMTNNLRLVIGS